MSRRFNALAPAVVTYLLAFQAVNSLKLNPGNILLMDHLNINHEKSRHDLLKAFYFDSLGMAIDPRKTENLEKGRKTLWANAGINQFHLPESDEAQVLDGTITVAYKEKEDLLQVERNLANAQPILCDSLCKWQWTDGIEKEDFLLVTDPWGSQFHLVCDAEAVDKRGVQPGSPSVPCAIKDICMYIAPDKSLLGVKRFYEQIMDAPCLTYNDATGSVEAISVVVSPQQTLTFKHRPKGEDNLLIERKNAELERDEATGAISVNHGPHVSMYVADLPATYDRAAQLGVTFVNHRFNRRAYNKEEAIDQCMFRCLEIVDPEDSSSEPILYLEHEIRSIVTSDGKKYKSCPFAEVPSGLN